MATYQVVILGLKPGQDRDEALQRLAATFKQPVERLSSLVHGTRAVVKRGADIALAAKLQAAIDAAGFESVVEPETSVASPNTAAAELAGQHASAAQAPSTPARVSRPRLVDANPLDGATSSAERTAATTPVRWRRVAVFALAAIAVAIALAITKPFSRTSSSALVRESASAPPTRLSMDAQFSPSQRLLLTVANSEWACANTAGLTMRTKFIVTVVEDQVVAIMAARGAKGQNTYRLFWRDAKDAREELRQHNLADDEVLLYDIDNRANAILRIQVAPQGMNFNMWFVAPASSTPVNCALQARDDVNDRNTQAVRKVLLESR